jgi:hypothetical protein|tara:strand:+ start:410 stop:772 length:363 start_codon:yes stop_codon:yes gene_type:complete
MNDRDKILYLTGLFDGEGHVSLLKKNHHKYLKKTNKMKTYTYTELSLRLSNTNKNVLNYIQKYFGGHIYVMKKYAPHHKTAWEWHINGKNATEISKLMYPFSIIKKEKLKTAKEFYDSVP